MHRRSNLTSCLIAGLPFAAALAHAVHAGQVTFPDLIHHWPADGSAMDVAGGANGTLNGPVGFVAGRFGQAFGFDSGGFITFGNTTCNVGPSDFTLSFWVRRDAPGKMALFTKRPLCGLNQMIDLRMRETDELSAEFSGPQASSYTSMTAQGSFGDGAWHHVAWRRQALTLSIFIDGCLKASQDSPGPIAFANAAPFTAGKSPCTGSFDGTIPFVGALDEIQVYLRALSDEEIALLAERGGSPDLDCSGSVDGADLGVLLGSWGPCRGPRLADLNGDGIVNGADLGLMLSSWG